MAKGPKKKKIRTILRMCRIPSSGQVQRVPLSRYLDEVRLEIDIHHTTITPQGLTQFWLRSPGHVTWMVETNLDEVGLVFYLAEKDAEQQAAMEPYLALARFIMEGK